MGNETVQLGWVVKASKIVKGTRMRKGVVKEVTKEKVKIISERFVNREAADTFCRIARQSYVPHTYEDVWVSEDLGYET